MVLNRMFLVLSLVISGFFGFASLEAKSSVGEFVTSETRTIDEGILVAESLEAPIYVSMLEATLVDATNGTGFFVGMGTRQLVELGTSLNAGVWINYTGGEVTVASEKTQITIPHLGILSVGEFVPPAVSPEDEVFWTQMNCAPTQVACCEQQGAGSVVGYCANEKTADLDSCNTHPEYLNSCAVSRNASNFAMGLIGGHDGPVSLWWVIIKENVQIGADG